jgi:outer membrane immunogenic protein
MKIFQSSNIAIPMAAFSLIGVVLAIDPAGVQAADLAGRPYTKAPAMVVAAYDWSGLYVGANGGWGSSRQCWDALAPNGTSFADGCHDASGAVAGGHIGYRMQRGAWVFGVEAQGDWADLRGSGISPLSIPPINVNESRVDGLGLFTGQIGYAVNAALVYVKGGAAVTSSRYTAINNLFPTLTTAASDTRWGGTIGLGVEYGFAPNWSVGLEYDHLFMPDRTDGFKTVSTLFPPIFAGNERISQDIDLVTVRVNYRLGGSTAARP